MLGFDVGALLVRMLAVSPRVQDVVFAVGKPPLVTVDGGFQPVDLEGLERMTPFHNEMIVLHLLAMSPHAARAVRDRGAASFSFSVPGVPRFRASVFQQRGSFAAVLRAIPPRPPQLAELGLARAFADVLDERAGIVLVNGPSGSGRSTTMAALVEAIKERRPCHIVTIEAPIEFLHQHGPAIVHQREVGPDTPSLHAGLEDALRQGADVLFVSQLADRETAALALEAAETGHLVVTSVRGLDTGSALRRLVGLFEPRSRRGVSQQLARSLRLSFTQRLVARRAGGRRVVAEVWRNLPSTRRLLERGELGSQPIADALRDAIEFGVEPFDWALERCVRGGDVARDTALAEAVEPRQLELRLIDLGGAP